jgi:polyphosphate glucokinase
MEILGIDIGGTGIKGAPVDTDQGKVLDERFRVLTPQPSTPEAVAECMADVAQHFHWEGRIGCGVPAVVKKGVAFTAANIDPSWVGADIKTLFEKESRCKVTVINDADAAGLAEMRFGAGAGNTGVVLMVTLGTGIGTALFTNGQLLPNTELGHLEVRGKDAELRASERVRLQKELSWKQWARRVDEYLNAIERLLWPDLIIIGGGASKHYAKFVPYLTVQAQIVSARMLNEAGIVGGALAALSHTLY